MRTISAKIPDSDNRLLERMAKGMPGGKSSAVVRDAVHQYCTKAASGKAQRNAIIDRAFGAFKDAPLDAKKHRETLSERMI
ncbi:MAG: hypothetical protein ABFR33_04885 [Verrucomicrobiota bacterium]